MMTTRASASWDPPPYPRACRHIELPSVIPAFAGIQNRRRRRLNPLHLAAQRAGRDNTPGSLCYDFRAMVDLKVFGVLVDK